jgi:uncharacterized protein YcfJ
MKSFTLLRCSTALIAIAALASAGVATARHRGGYGPEYDYARVIRVDPILDVVEHPVTRDECFEERVTYREPPRYRDRDRAPAVLGGIIGGVLGNQVGSGHGRDAATVAGAALGYSLARDSQRRNGGYYSPGREVTRYEPRCTTRTEYRRDEQVTGYDVTYRYNGRTYHTVTDYHPGDRIRVEVDMDVRPVR